MVEGSSPFSFVPVVLLTRFSGAVTLPRRRRLVGSGLPFAARKNGPSAAVLTVSSAAGAIRTPVKHRFGNEATRLPETTPRRRRSGPLRDRFTACADRAAQRSARPDQPAPAAVGARVLSAPRVQLCGVLSAASGTEPAGKRWRNEASLAGCRGPRHSINDGSADPGGHRVRVLPARAHPAGRLRAVAAKQRRREPPLPPPPTPAELELEREMEYFVEPEEAFTRDEIE